MIKRILVVVIFPILSSTLYSQQIYYCIGDVVNVRKNPSLESEIIGSIKNGEKVEVLGKSINEDQIYLDGNNYSSKWYKISTNKINGWVYGIFLQQNYLGIPKPMIKSNDELLILYLIGFSNNKMFYILKRPSEAAEVEIYNMIEYDFESNSYKDIRNDIVDWHTATENGKKDSFFYYWEKHKFYYYKYFRTRNIIIHKNYRIKYKIENFKITYNRTDNGLNGTYKISNDNIEYIIENLPKRDLHESKVCMVVETEQYRLLIVKEIYYHGEYTTFRPVGATNISKKRN